MHTWATQSKIPSRVCFQTFDRSWLQCIRKNLIRKGSTPEEIALRLAIGSSKIHRDDTAAALEYVSHCNFLITNTCSQVVPDKRGCNIPCLRGTWTAWHISRNLILCLHSQLSYTKFGLVAWTFRSLQTASDYSIGHWSTSNQSISNQFPWIPCR